MAITKACSIAVMLVCKVCPCSEINTCFVLDLAYMTLARKSQSMFTKHLGPTLLS